MGQLFFKKIAAVGLMLFSSHIFTNTSDTDIQTKIDQILNANTDPKIIGIKIQSMSTGATLYSKNADQLFVPASTLKLFTALGALQTLGENFTFQTQLLKHDNNFYIKFDGDPTLTDAQLGKLLSPLKNITINGNIVLDGHALAGRKYGPGWMWDELNLCYAAPIDGIMINQNCVIYNFSEQSKQKLTPKTPADKIHIVNATTLSKEDSKECPLELSTVGNNDYTLTGCVSKDSSLALSIALTDPAQHVEQLIRQLFKKQNTILNGKTVEGRMPKTRKLISRQISAPLSDLMSVMLKKSDNQIAEVLLKTTGARALGHPTSWAESSAALKKILAPKINLEQAVIVDGSGVSRYNLVTPDQLSAALALQKIPKESLPIAGTDGGTLKNRMKDISGKVWAKTGSMTGVESLAGYVQTKHQGLLSFVILMNNFSMSNEEAAQFEDSIVEKLTALE